MIRTLKLFAVVGILCVAACGSARTVSEEKLRELPPKVVIDPHFGPDHTVNILILSGGGSNGAWGAGVLNGWSKSDRVKRPHHFDVVTGISTGSLQATYAFLGEDYDATLKKVYTSVRNRDIFNNRSIFNVIFRGNSLKTTEPLGKLIEDHLTVALLRKVGRIARESPGRKILVGTVNLDTGYFYPWDLTAVAAGQPPYDKMSEEKRFKLYRDVIHASSSIPVLFNPIEIDGMYHVDGGVRAYLFIRDTLGQIAEKRKLFIAQKARAQADPPDPVVWIILNGGIDLPPKPVDNSIDKVALRSVELLLEQNRDDNLFRAAVFAKVKKMGFKFSFIPSDNTDNEDSHLFHKGRMGPLFKAGEKSGKAGIWASEILDPSDLGIVSEIPDR